VDGGSVRAWVWVTVAVCLSLAGPASAAADATAVPTNMFANPGFERGASSWRMDTGGGTEAEFRVDTEDSAEGRYSALVSVGRTEEWGCQFGQVVEAGQVGKTYTFAAFLKAADAPLRVSLRVERSARPWDAAVSKQFELKPGGWTELHVTFRLEKAFPEGWFAYVACAQPNSRFRVDMMRLYEGEYVPFAELERRSPAPPTVRVFDTGTPSSSPLSAGELAHRTGWREIGPGRTGYGFAGNAVLLNGRVALVVRPGASGAELCSMEHGDATVRAALRPVGRHEGARVASVRLAKCGPEEGAVEATFEGKDGSLSLSFTLKMGQAFVRVDREPGVTGLRVEAPCRFVVMPDFFADDIVIDAREQPGEVAELPSENFLLHMVGDGDAIVMTVSGSKDEPIAVRLGGEESARRIIASAVQYGSDDSIWVAVLAAPGIWHVRDVSAEDRGKVLDLDWTAPYPAQWRVDWRRSDGLTDTWEMVMETRDGNYIKHDVSGGRSRLGPDRRRWTTVLGWFEYPCWADRSRRGHFQPLKKVLTFDGPALIYPIDRTADTPLDRYTIVDLVRETLGVGPCQYILDLEGQRSQYKGIATCGARDTLNPIYEKGEQKRQKARIERTLKDVVVFIRHIRGRIESYRRFAHEIRDYLRQQKTAHPELAGEIDELITLTTMLDEHYEARKARIKTPEYAQDLADRFRATLLDYEGPDAFQKCRQFTKAWVEIGSNQDELVGECRWIMKMIRQRAGLIMARQPRMADICTEVRRRARSVMRNPAGHEGATH